MSSPTPFEIHTVAQQFTRVENELATLRGMVRELLAHPAEPAPEPPAAGPPRQRPTYPEIAYFNGVPLSSPPKGALLNLQGEPVHFDGHHWKPGPSPTNPEGLDVPPGQG